jgi:uncharacterized phiE125 gp8 family phage protein
MALTLHTKAALQPIALADAKQHLRVDIADEDALISALIDAATQSAEHIMGRAIMPQKWLLTADKFDAVMRLEKPTVTVIDSIKYVDTSGALVTLSPSAYQGVLASSYAAYVIPAFGQVWPETRQQPEAVQIVFSCGYADAASVPAAIIAWIKLCLGAMHENRSLATDRPTHSLGFADSLLDVGRVY